MDDIVIYSSDVAEYMQQVRAVLTRLSENSLFVKISKWEFNVDELPFLDYRISTTGLSIDPERIKAINEWPVPRSFYDI